MENHQLFAETVTRMFLGGHEVKWVPTMAAAREHLRQASFAVVLVDYDLDDGKGDALVRELVAQRFGGRIIAVSAHHAGNQALLAVGAHLSCPKGAFQSIAALLPGE